MPRRSSTEIESTYLANVEEVDVRFERVKQAVKKKFNKPDYDPLVEMALIANDDTYKDAIRIEMHKQIAEFVYPKVRNLDFTNPGRNSLKISIEIQPWAGADNGGSGGRVIDVTPDKSGAFKGDTTK